MTIDQCCRYNYSLIENSSIKSILLHNEWIFNDTQILFSFFDASKIRKLPEDDSVLQDNCVFFNSAVHHFYDWIDCIAWDKFHTWYAYNYPTNMANLAKPWVIIDQRNELEINEDFIQGKEISQANYFALSNNWRFIHKLSPDIFLSKVGSAVLIGGLDYYFVWLIQQRMSKKCSYS